MKQTTAPRATPSPSKGKTKPNNTAAKTYNPTSEFIGAALNMSWQLAIVVLVPILIGFQLDKALNMAPLLTIVGFLFAMVGTGLIMWRQLQMYGPASTVNAKERKV